MFEVARSDDFVALVIKYQTLSINFSDSLSIHSDDDPYDEMEKPTVPKFHGSTYNTLRGGDMYKPVSHTAAAAPSPPTGKKTAVCNSGKTILKCVHFIIND